MTTQSMLFSELASLPRFTVGERSGCWTVIGDLDSKGKIQCRCVCGTCRRLDPPTLLTGPASCGCQEDFFTPEWVVHRLLDAGAMVDWLKGRGTPAERWLEPACGDGAIIRAVDSWVEARRTQEPSGGWGAPIWYAQDIRPSVIEALKEKDTVVGAADVGDFLRPSKFLALGDVIGAIICNPPFSLATEFVMRAMSTTNGPVAMLLQLGWLASAHRSSLLRLNPPDVYVLPNRPSFTADGKTDLRDYLWCVWGPTETRHRARGTFQVLEETPAEQRCNHAAVRDGRRPDVHDGAGGY